MYSWASNGNVESYVSDEENVQLTKKHLINFLINLNEKTKPKNIHIIAHSMGNRALTEALKDFSRDNKKLNINQVILAAPDINKKIFEQEIVPNISKMAKQFTIYTSNKDRALLASQKIHKYYRVGNVKANYNGFNTVDISEINCDDIFYHGCFAESRPVMMDIHQLFQYYSEPKDRNLVYEGKYWKLRKD